MNKRKKWFCMILALVMFVINFPVHRVHAQEAEVTDEDLDLMDYGAVCAFLDELPSSVEQFEALPQGWWDELLPNERTQAEVVWKRLRDGYDGEPELPDTLESYLEKLESGISAEELFTGTILDGMDAESLRKILEEGHTLTELLKARESVISYGGSEVYLRAEGVTVGYDPSPVNRKWLNGQDAFCYDEFKKFPNGASYPYKEADAAMVNNGAGYIVQFYVESEEDNNHWWSTCQVALWAYVQGYRSYEQALSFTNQYLRARKITDPGALDDYRTVVPKLVVQADEEDGVAYLYEPANSANQRMITSPPIWGDPLPEETEPLYDEVEVHEERNASRTHAVSIARKYSSFNGEEIRGAEFEVFEEGVFKGKIITDENGYGSLSWQYSRTGEGSGTARYCSNYEQLTDKQKSEVTCHTSYEAAYSAAREEAIRKAKAAADAAADRAVQVIVREVSAPDGFSMGGQKEQQITLAGDDSHAFHISNTPMRSKLILEKVDGITGKRIEAAAAFELFEWNGSSYEVSTDYEVIRLEDGHYTAAAKYADAEPGYLYYTQRNQGKFAVQEKMAPTGYYGDFAEGIKRIYEIDIPGPGSVITIQITNERVYGEVTVKKYDNEAEGFGITQGDVLTLNGAVYGLYAAEDIYSADGSGLLYEKDQLVQTAAIGKSVVTDDGGYILDEDGIPCARSGKEPKLIVTDGQTRFCQIELGRYYVSEISPAMGYLSDTTVHRGDQLTKYSVTFSYEGEAKKVVSRREKATDDRNLLTLDDSLDSGDIHTGDRVIKQAAQFIKVWDDDPTEKVPISGVGFTVYRIAELIGVKEGMLVPAGTGWTGEDMEQFAGYDFSRDQAVTLYKRPSETWTAAETKWLKATDVVNQYRVAEMFSDEKGYFCTPELPFGQYVLVETTVPEGKKQADPILITIARDSANAQELRYIGNESLTVNIRIVKEDADGEEGHRTVLKEGAAYRIRLLSDPEEFHSSVWNLDGENFLWYYNATLSAEHGSVGSPFQTKVIKKNGIITDAYVDVAQPLPFGTYELWEVQAPTGYVLKGEEQKIADVSVDGIHGYEIRECPEAEKVTFEISDKTLDHAIYDEYGREILVVKQENREQKGIMEITKQGEKLYAVQAADAPFKDMIFEYRLAPVAEAEFAIYAAADIYDQQIRGDRLDQYSEEDLRRYRVYEKGEWVGSIVTDQNGYGYLANLPLGKYIIREVAAGDGFVLDPNEEMFELCATEDTCSFVIYDTDSINQRQKISVEAVKRDEETKAPLAGAVFGLYNQEDILSFLTYDGVAGRCINTVDGRVLAVADTLIATAITDEDGVAAFSVDLPLGRYYIRELESPQGYTSLSKDGKIELDGSYQGQSVEVQEYDEEDGLVFFNQPVVGNIFITKEGEFLTAVESTVWDAERGYFRTVFDYAVGRVKGANFEIRVRDTIYTPDQTGNIARYGSIELVKDALVAVVETDHTGVASLEGLPLGQYYVTEVAAGEGEFLLDPAIAEVTLAYGGQNIPVVMDHSVRYINKRQRIELNVAKWGCSKAGCPHRGDDPAFAEDHVALAGAVFGLYNMDPIYGYEIDEQTGTVTSRVGAMIAEGTLVETAVSKENGMVTFAGDLPHGKWMVKEIQAPQGYVLCEETYIFDAAYTGAHGEEVIRFHYDVHNEPVPEESEIPQETETPGRDVTPPMTGDQSPLFLCTLGTGISGIGMVVAWKKKRAILRENSSDEYRSMGCSQ